MKSNYKFTFICALSLSSFQSVLSCGREEIDSQVKKNISLLNEKSEELYRFIEGFGSSGDYVQSKNFKGNTKDFEHFYNDAQAKTKAFKASFLEASKALRVAKAQMSPQEYLQHEQELFKLEETICFSNRGLNFLAGVERKKKFMAR